jgi:hypothetical protein
MGLNKRPFPFSPVSQQASISINQFCPFWQQMLPLGKYKSPKCTQKIGASRFAGPNGAGSPGTKRLPHCAEKHTPTPG